MYGRALLATVIAGIVLQGFSLWSLAVLTSALAALCALGLVRRHRLGPPLALDAVVVLLLAAGLWLVVSAVLSPLPAQAGTGLYQQLVGVLACWAALLDHDAERTWQRLRVAAAVLCVVFAVSLLVEPLYSAQPRYSSFFVQRNSLSGYALLLVFVAAPMLAAPGRRWPWAVAVFLGCFIVCFSSSRAALGALVVGYLFLTLSAGPVFRAATGKLLLALGLWAFLLGNQLNQGALLQSMASVGVVSQQLLAESPFGLSGSDRRARQSLLDLSTLGRSKVASAHERWLIWQGSAAMIEDAPWHGYGPGTFHLVYPVHSPPGDGSARVYAHNDLMQIAAELGVPGVLLAGGLPLAVLLRVRSARRPPGEAAGALDCDSLCAGLVALTAHSVFDYNFYVPATLILSGCVLARVLMQTAVAPRWTSAPARHFGRRSFIVIVTVLALLPLLVLGSATLMRRNHDLALAALADGRLPVAAQALARAAVLYPHERIELARAQLYLAAFDASRARAQQAEFLDLAQSHLARAERMNPYLPEVPFVRLLLAERQPGLDPAARAQALAEAYAETLRRDRRYFQVRLELARYLYAHGQGEQARGLLEAGLVEPFPMHPQVVDYLELLQDLRLAAGDAAGAERAARELERLRPLYGAAA